MAAVRPLRPAPRGWYGPEEWYEDETGRSPARVATAWTASGQRAALEARLAELRDELHRVEAELVSLRGRPRKSRASSRGSERERDP